MVIGKKRGVALILYALLMWFSMTCPLWAAEADVVELINLLKSKNVVTQQEAESLLKEMDKNREKERAEIKKDISDSAKKGDFLPSALKGFKFGTTIFAEWNAKDYDNGESTNEFIVNRAYLTLTKEINSWLDLNVTTDIFQSKDKEDDKGNGWEIRLKYAYANLNLGGTNTRFGMIPTPSDSYDSTIWPYRVQGKNLLDDAGIQSSADFGLSNQGTFGGDLDDEEYLQYAGKSFAGKWGGYMAGIYNGSGYTDSEENDNKAVSGLIYVRPLPNVPIMKGFQLAYTGTYGESNKKFETGQTDNNPDWAVNMVSASLQHRLFTIMGQYYWGKGAYNSKEENDREGYLAEGFVRIPQFEKLRVFAKYYYFDPNTDADDDSYKTYVAGLSYDFCKEFMPFVAYEHREYEVQTAKLVDYDKYQIGFQLKF